MSYHRRNTFALNLFEKEGANMARNKQSTGQCTYCGQVISKGGMPKHLSACLQRQAILVKAQANKQASELLHHLRVQADGLPVFWLDLEMRGLATLKDLDSYLRAIWLECCGNMSRFSNSGWRGQEISMARRIDAVFEPGVSLTHIYDFGTSSETLVKLLGTRQAKPTTSKPIALMARNLMPESLCIECGQSAAWFCNECLIEDQTSGTLCEAHAKTLPHDNYGEPIELMNSPRMGMCGYEGPATPPY
jgi:hypothetical protein